MWYPLAPHYLGGRQLNSPLVGGDYLEFAQNDFRAWAIPRCNKTGYFKELGPRAVQLKLLSHGAIRTRLESWAVSGARAGIEYRYPLLDKRLIEFALGLPPEFYHRLGYGRYLFRRATENVMPGDICWGDYKLEPVRVAEATSLMAKALKHHTLELGSAGSQYIDRSRLGRFLEAIPGDECELDPKFGIFRLQAAFRSIMILGFSGSQSDWR